MKTEREATEHTTVISSAFLSYIVHKLSMLSARDSAEWKLAIGGSTDELLAFYRAEFDRLMAGIK